MKVVDFVGYSGSGKTTLVEKLIEIFSTAGLNVAALKDAHHGFEMDRPGKDSCRFRCAGAKQVIVRSDDRWVLLTETPQQRPSLKELLEQLAPCDLVLVEGFKSEEAAALRLEVYREGVCDEKPIALRDPGICAVVSDHEPADLAGSVLPVLNINDPASVAGWVAERLGIDRGLV